MKTHNLIENSVPISCKKQICFELVMNSCWIYYRRQKFKCTIETITHFHFHFSFPFLIAMDTFWLFCKKTRNKISKFISNTIKYNNINLKIDFNYLHVDVHQIITKKYIVPMFYFKEAIKNSKANCMFSKCLFKPCFFVSPNTPQAHLVVVQQYFLFFWLL
jgi:hypothetical protein